MGLAVKTARSVRLAENRKTQQRVIPLSNPTLPPSVEEFHNRTWFAVYTDPGREFAARADLASRGFSVFLPVRAKWTGLRFRTKRAVEFPLLVRYLFIGAPREFIHRQEFQTKAHGVRTIITLNHDGWSTVLSAEGVHSVLGTSYGLQTSPVRMPHENLISLAGEVLSGVYDETKELWRQGDAVTITGGALRGFTATLDQTVPPNAGLDDPIAVVAKMLGQESVIKIPLADLQKVA